MLSADILAYKQASFLTGSGFEIRRNGCGAVKSCVESFGLSVVGAFDYCIYDFKCMVAHFKRDTGHTSGADSPCHVCGSDASAVGRVGMAEREFKLFAFALYIYFVSEVVRVGKVKDPFGSSDLKGLRGIVEF